jgi:predicted amidohydrolase YtcJ
VSHCYWINGQFLTLDSQLPEAYFVETNRGRILRTGTRDEWRTVSGAIPPRVLSRMVRDLGGGTVVPGFNDNHIHTVAYGDMHSRVRLGGMDAPSILRLLTERYGGIGRGKTILAQGWDYDSVPEPRKELLDEAFPDNPVILLQFSGHGAWVNSRVLKKLSITQETPDPPGGVIVRDQKGEPTGVLRDAAILPLHERRFISLHADPRKNRRFLVRALRSYARMGITSVQDNTWFPTTLIHLAALRSAGALTCRFTCWPYGPAPAMARMMGTPGTGGRFIRIGPWKYFLDGTFSTKTAWLHEPYEGEAQNTGSPTGNRAYYYGIVRKAAEKRRQTAFHAIGDRAVSTLLDAVEAAAATYPEVTTLRLRLEHAQLVRKSDMPRLRRLGVLIAAQPHAMWNPEKDRTLLGNERYERAYPYRSLLDAGVHLSFGSDVPGEDTADPLYGIHLAVNRPGAEAITPEEALRCYTVESAYAEGQESVKGTLSPGAYADFAVLSDNPLTVPPNTIKDLVVLETVVAGKSVFRRGAPL